MKTIAVTDYTI